MSTARWACRYSTVRNHVRRSAARRSWPRRAGRGVGKRCRQTHPPAAEAEFDSHDLWVVLRGVKTKTALFTVRLSYSGRAAHKACLERSDTELALALASSLLPLWLTRGRIREGKAYRCRIPTN